MKIIFNSSPLIFLIKLGYLNKIFKFFNYIIIPEKVIEEISSKDDFVKKTILELIEQKKIKVNSTNLKKLFHALNLKLGKGEAEAIALALELDCDFVILDDFVARKKARDLGLKVKGTLGIIKSLLENKVISVENFEELFNHLKKIGFRVTRNIFYKIFEE